MPLHNPPLQVSLAVQGLLSVQLAALSAKVQPVWAVQPSSVQRLPSAQGKALPGWHRPPAQVSPIVQRLPSSQAPETAAKLQPLMGLQLSVVHGLLSSQFTLPVALHKPAWQPSPVLQALPSSQLAVVGAYTQPPVESQLSVVHGLPSLQVTAGPPLQLPPAHVSVLVQALPSLQGMAAAIATQPLAGSHKSKVQGLLSAHARAVPGLQLPPVQTSFWVQALPSLQGKVVWTNTQPLAGLQLSVVQGLPSLQASASPPLQALS